MKHSRQGVLNWFIRQIIDGEKIKLFGSGNQIRDINFVDDVVEAFLRAGLSDKVWGQAYNLGGNPTSHLDFVKLAIKARGRGKFEIVDFPSDRKEIEIGDYIADYSKITRDLGWRPKSSLAEGIKRTVQFYERYQKHYW